MVESVKLGIRFGVTTNDDRSTPIPAQGMVEVFDIETGKKFEQFFEVHLEYSINRPIVAVMKFYPGKIESR